MDITHYLDRDKKLSYDPENVIGRGSFGIVYKGLYLNKQVAVKRIQRSHGVDESVLQEVEFMMKAEAHPNSLRYICTHKDDNYVYEYYIFIYTLDLLCNQCNLLTIVILKAYINI